MSGLKSQLGPMLILLSHATLACYKALSKTNPQVTLLLQILLYVAYTFV